jgi:hypothetical protein
VQANVISHVLIVSAISCSHKVARAPADKVRQISSAALPGRIPAGEAAFIALAKSVKLSSFTQ